MRQHHLLNHTASSQHTCDLSIWSRPVEPSKNIGETVAPVKGLVISPINTTHSVLIKQTNRHKGRFAIQGHNLPTAELEELEMIGRLFNCRLRLHYENYDSQSIETSRRSTEIDSYENAKRSPDYMSNYFNSKQGSPDGALEGKTLMDLLASDESNLSKPHLLKSPLNDRYTSLRRDESSQLHYPLPQTNQVHTGVKPLRFTRTVQGQCSQRNLRKSKSVDSYHSSMLWNFESEGQSDVKSFDYTLSNQLQDFCYIDKKHSDNSSDDLNVDDDGISIRLNDAWIQKITNSCNLFQKFKSEVADTNQQICKSIAIQMFKPPDQSTLSDKQENLGSHESDRCQSETDSDVEIPHLFSLLRA